MSKKIDNHLLEHEEFEIFGEHKTREQIKTEEKARKAAERKAMAEVAKARREAANAPVGAHSRRDVWNVVLVLGILVALCVGMLAIQFYKEEQNNRFNRDENQVAYYLDETAQPEMSAEGIKSAVKEIYYTQGGHIAVRLVLSNGTQQHLRMVDIEVKLEKQDGTLIAGGYAQVKNEVVILTNYTTEYTFYISPEHIQNPVDAFTNINCIVTASGEPTVETTE